jgi:N,N-dimethylformamidase beta subunit-like protein
MILGHQEYITQREYDNLKQFVGNGGVMIILDGNIFYPQVKYDKNAQNISLVKGHSCAYTVNQHGELFLRDGQQRHQNGLAVIICAIHVM